MSDDVRTKLLDRFSGVDHEKQTGIWDKVWQEGVTPWDRNSPSPALREALTSHHQLLLKPSSRQTPSVRKKALVPGCGKGYDVALLASYSCDAVGLDVSPTALNQARQLYADPASLEADYPVQDPQNGRGKTEFMLGDFFTNEAFEKFGTTQFDIIYDYTFLCALPPVMRPRWAKRMSELLAPSGILICLEFPLFKDPAAPGPPHGLTAELYEELLKAPGASVEYHADGRVKQNAGLQANPTGLVRRTRWKAEKTHQAGQGTDHISIWEHVSE